MAVLFIFLFVFYDIFYWTIIFVPFLLLPLMLVSLGVSWIISATAVHVRDINQGIGLIILMLLFMSPVFYERSSIPEALQPWMYINPITWIIEQMRNVIFLEKLPDFIGYIKYTVAAFLIAWFGNVWFRRLSSGFSDII